ncbi:hypothetical protein ACLB2K_016111 [Fragaria x ananassa]
MDDDYSIPASSARPGKSTMSEDEIMELVWHNGQLVMHSQSQRPAQKRSKYDVVIPEHITAPAAPPQQQPETQPQLFMHEDEMASWLHYPLNDDDSFCSDLLYNNSSNVQPNNNNNTIANPPPAPPRPPVHPHPQPRRSEAQNFLLFSRLNSNNNNKSRFDSAAAAQRSVVRETTTVVDSSDTPLVGPGSGATESRLDNNASPGISMSGGGGRGLATATTATAASAGKDALTCEMSLTSSPGGGSTSASGSLSAELVSTQKPPPPPVDRKRKGREREPDDAECQSERDVEFESGSAKKVHRGSSSTKRSRAAEVHNLSERRRRDRINEKMRTLQELIPRCNKSDKASMLEEAIEYLKSLQLQVQMMSMGCGMVPMMFPGVQPYMPMGMARMGMGMGMGMDMGMNRPMMPYGNVLAGSPMPTAAAAAHMRPRIKHEDQILQILISNTSLPSRCRCRCNYIRIKLWLSQVLASRVPVWDLKIKRVINEVQILADRSQICLSKFCSLKALRVAFSCLSNAM